MINIILWIIFGALVGWIASLIMGTDEQQGGLTNIVVGIVGAIVGGYIARMLGAQGVTGFNMASFMFALIGAIILIGVFKIFARG